VSLMGLSAWAQAVRADNIEAELVTATQGVVPGQVLQVALRLKHAPHWHTYWQVPGDSGLPTRLSWDLPPGWHASELSWPLPQRLPVGPLMNFGYEDEVFLLAQLTPPADLKTGGAAYLNARADWLICKDVCIPGGADLRLIVPVVASAPPSPWARSIEATQRLVPKPGHLPQQQAHYDGTYIELRFVPEGAVQTMAFFPLIEGQIEAAARQTLLKNDDQTVLRLKAGASQDMARLRGVVVLNGGPNQAAKGGGAVEIDVPIEHRAAVVAAVQGDPLPSPMPLAGGAMRLSFGLAILGALVGGLILNLMPCVFPVLSLKLIALMAHQRAPGHHHAMGVHGWVYAAGVIASFVLLAAFVLILRAGGAGLGWGFQLQNPWVVMGLVSLFFLIGLNLLGAFEFTLGSGLAGIGSAQRLQSDRLSGSFGTGVLAVVVAAPCTAPFMGAAVGYALTSPVFEALAVFIALGVGMAAPYVLLTTYPKLLARLPKPGAWMERFKQAMAFPMFATGVWLLWVLLYQIGSDATALLLAALVCLGFTVWAYGLKQRGALRFVWASAIGLVVTVMTVFGVAQIMATPQAQASMQKEWADWSPQAQQTALQTGQPVFVDFTATWCVTCQFNKRTALRTDAAERAFIAHKVVRLKADWTNQDKTISRELERFGRSGVPLYVLYDRQGQPHVLPELLTERIVIDALERL